MPWSKEDGARLQELLAEHGQRELATAAGVSVATWQRTIGGDRAPTVEEIAGLRDLLPPDDMWRLILATFEGVMREPWTEFVALMEGAMASGRPAPEVVQVPVHDVQVAAGAGKIADRLPPPLYHWSFSREWMEANLRGVGRLVMVEVSGSSQEPELSNGDLVAVDLDQSRLREGLFVVRLDDVLVIKHIQMDGRTVRLVSRNPLYDPVEIDLHEPGIDDRFEVVGRAVWASKML